MLSLPDFKKKQIIIAYLSFGDKLSFKNDNVLIKDKDGKTKHQSTCYRLFAIFIIGNASITTGLLQRAKKFRFNIIFLTHGLKVYGEWLCGSEGNFLLRHKQYHYNGTDIAKHLVKNKISEQVLMLEKRKPKSDKIKHTIHKLHEYIDTLPYKGATRTDLLSIEGRASKLYFSSMFDNIEWKGRTPRAKQDIVNLLLDIGYMQLFHFVDALLLLYGFDTYKGVYHTEFYQRKSLCADIVEPFRPIVDYRVRKAYTLGIVNPDDFDFIDDRYRLFGKSATPYTKWLLLGLLEHKDEIFLYIQKYYRAFMREKPIEQYPFFRSST